MAGVSFCDIFAENFKDKEICVESPAWIQSLSNENFLFHTNFDKWVQRENVDAKEKIKKYKVISGHIFASKYLIYFNDLYKVIWLRNPISRLISQYYFWLYNSATPYHVKPKDTNLMQFARLSRLRNVMSDLFLKGVDINDFDFIGIVEYFETDFDDFCKISGLTKIPTPRRNLTKYPKDFNQKISIKNYEELYMLNQKDFELYNYALNIRKRRKI